MSFTCSLLYALFTLGDTEALDAAKKKAEENIKKLKGDVENLELSLNKAETEKQTKDNQIKTLNEEMARQDEAVSILADKQKDIYIILFHMIFTF